MHSRVENMHVLLCVSVYVFMHVFLCLYMYVSMYVYMYICMHLYVFVCIFMCRFVCTYVYMRDMILYILVPMFVSEYKLEGIRSESNIFLLVSI